jgi:DNA-binding MarR family transcriptional regulator
MTDSEQRCALADECAGAAHRLMAALARTDAPAWLHLEISMAQFKALMAIATRGPLMVGALARALGISEPSASLLVDRLEEHELARREIDPEDRRRTLVVPTTTAIELLERLQQGRRERFAELIGDLSDDELAALRLGISALARAAEDDATTASHPPVRP